MLIINADDFGKSMETTNNIVMCFREKRITSSSAMVFMQDSERAASLDFENSFEVGLHLNFDEQFTGDVPALRVKEYLTQTAAFLTGSKLRQVMYNPMLQRQFEYLYNVQYEEFIRLYRRPPSHINGHHHRHLCSNVLFGRIIPDGSRVRRSFTFMKGERSFGNRLYRRAVDTVLKRRYITTDMFFAASPAVEPNYLMQKVELAKNHNVELMVHLSSQREVEYLMRQDFIDSIGEVPRGTYRDLPVRTTSKDPVRTDVSTNL
jgi:predicted glycoside hydrolase/deacetylase ChbG (UPF0249 family)